MKCSISLERLVDPVIASDGHTYSRTEIQHWFDSGRKTSPKTNAPLPNLKLLQNWLAKSQIDKWCEEKNSSIMFSTKLTTVSILSEGASIANGSTVVIVIVIFIS